MCPKCVWASLCVCKRNNSVLKGGDCFSGNSREESYRVFFFFFFQAASFPCRPLEWRVSNRNIINKSALNSAILSDAEANGGEKTWMQEGTISGNAACNSLYQSEQICLQLVQKTEVEEGDVERWGRAGALREEVVLRPLWLSEEWLDSWHRANRENLRWHLGLNKECVMSPH